MVTDEERDYMYQTYARDPQMRINLGIRRRLAPLLDNDRRRIELLNSLALLFSGLADYLLRRRDRDGRQHLPGRPRRRAHADAMVRERNAGFSAPLSATGPAASHGSAVRLRRGERRSARPAIRFRCSVGRGLMEVRGKHRSIQSRHTELFYPTNRRMLAYLREL